MAGEIQRIAVMGLGLMGGSLGLALKHKKLAVRVRGYARRSETRQMAMRMGAADEVFDKPGKAVAGADIVVYCVPVLCIPGLAKECVNDLTSGCVITDVGSTKAELMTEMKTLFEGSAAIYVGSHPVAGSERSGLEAARADLFEGAVAAITPAGAERRAVRKVEWLWRKLGCKTVEMDPVEHDELVAATSHLPHLVAALLVDAVAAGRSDKLKYLCGPGFRDTTRIAEGSPAVWRDIIRSNRQFILQRMHEFHDILEKVIRMAETGNFDGVQRFLERCKENRRNICAGDKE